ncbi:MAG: helix-turn-helix transcriptional regulator [Armatimonadetes bacterium]|nr:helix-turn-helix transcriptional regulator [Armatimonadota bacterium]
MPADPPCHYELFWCHVNHTLVRLDRTMYAPPSRFRIGPSVELDGSRYLENSVSAVADELAHRELGWLDSVHGLLQYLSFAILRRIRRGEAVYLRDATAPAIAADLRVWRTIQAALQFCDANFRRPITAKDVATAVGYSPSYLSRAFSRHLGRSISEHLRYLRMTTARHMLETTDLPIAEIALAIGYSDHSHFTRAFTRFTGTPPKHCRRRADDL